MLRKLLLLALWFPASLGLILYNLRQTSYISYTHAQKQYAAVLSPLPDQVAYLVASGNTSRLLDVSIIADDARAKLLEKFLRTHESPMAEHAQHIVSEADANQIDYRLVVAIAMCESNLGKRIPANSYNAWGIAVYTGQNSGANFRDWPHAISWVSKYLKTRYFDRGYKTLDEIGATYAPPSVHTGNSWSNCVDSFQRDIL